MSEPLTTEEKNGNGSMKNTISITIAIMALVVTAVTGAVNMANNMQARNDPHVATMDPATTAEFREYHQKLRELMTRQTLTQETQTDIMKQVVVTEAIIVENQHLIISLLKDRR